MSKFKKNEHRPWKTALLQNVLETKLPDSKEHSFAWEFDQKLLSSSKEQTQGILNKRAAVRSHQPMPSSTTNDTCALSMGGFLPTQNLGHSNTSTAQQQMHHLLQDMQSKQTKVGTLANDLKISQALERAEAAELSRKSTEQARFAAEQRMQESIEQANVAVEQFHLAMEKATLAAQAHKEEEHRRILAEQAAASARERAEQAEIAMSNERQLRVNAEEKARVATRDAEQATEYKTQAHELSSKVKEVEEKFHILQGENLVNTKELEGLRQRTTDFRAIEQELEQKNQELIRNNREQQQRIDELERQQNKLKQIIDTEQNIRKNAEKKLTQVLTRAEEAEKARINAEKKLVVVEDKAKKAMAHANQMVMQFIDQPMSDKPRAKPKVNIARDEDLDDDYSF